jgi:hypothetical protein
MDRRWFLQLATTFSVGTGALLCGCGGGGKAAVSATRTGAVDGFLFRDGSGALVLGRSGTPPPGTVPVPDAIVTAIGPNRQTRTRADGRFALDNLPAGLHTLRLQPSAGAALDAPITVIGGATITLGETAISRTAAVARAGEALAGAGVTTLAGAAIFAPQQPLPPGVFVAPRFAAPTIDTETPGARSLTQPTWFLFVDLAPGEPFAHPVRFVFVDSQTGDVEIQSATSWPTFNAQHFYGPREDIIASPDLIQPGRSVPRPTERASLSSVPARTRAEATRRSHYLFLYAFSDHSSAIRNDSFFGHVGIPVDVASRYMIDWWNPLSGRTLKEDFLVAFDQARKDAAPGDTIVLDINSHGGLDAAGQYFMWIPVRKREWFEGIAVQASEMLRPAEIALDQCRACDLFVMVGTCHAGGWIEHANAHLDLAGKRIAILAACAKDRSTHGNLGLGEGSYANEAFRRALALEPPGEGRDGLAAAFQAARDDVESWYFANGTENTTVPYPQIWTRTPADGEDCGISLTPKTSEIGTGQFAYLKVTLNHRPAGAPPVRVHLTTTLGELANGEKVGAAIDIVGEGTVSFDAATAGTATVTAEAFEKAADGTETSLGKATATITVKPLTVKLTPAGVTVLNGSVTDMTPVVQNYTKLDPKDKIEFAWTVTGDAGGRLSQSTTDDTTNAGITRYVAHDTKTGADIVGVTATLLTKAGKPVVLGVATATVRIKDPAPSGQVTVNVIAADPGYGASNGGSDWTTLIPLGARTFTMKSATKTPSSLGQFINAFFLGATSFDTFSWHGHVPSISGGVTVPAAPAGFSGSLDMLIPYELNGTKWRIAFRAYEGTITIKSVVGNKVTFEATARLERDLEDHISWDAGTWGHIDVTVSGYTTLVDEVR